MTVSNLGSQSSDFTLLWVKQIPSGESKRLLYLLLYSKALKTVSLSPPSK